VGGKGIEKIGPHSHYSVGILLLVVFLTRVAVAVVMVADCCMRRVDLLHIVSVAVHACQAVQLRLRCYYTRSRIWGCCWRVVLFLHWRQERGNNQGEIW